MSDNDGCRYFTPDLCVCDASGLDKCEYGESARRQDNPDDLYLGE